MNELQLYEQEVKVQIADLPLPDENMAWADMKRRLEEDDDDRLLPIWLRGCAVWGVVAIAVVGIGWWLITQLNNSSISHTVTATKQQARPSDGPESMRHLNTMERRADSGTLSSKAAEEKQSSTMLATPSGTQPLTSVKPERAGRKKKIVKRARAEEQVKDPADTIAAVSAISGHEPPVLIDSVQHAKDSGKNTIQSPLAADAASNASSRKTAGDSLTNKKNTAVKKIDQQNPATTSFAAGLAIHQLLPLAGQSFTPYNAAGRKGTLRDYIPAVYLRMYRNQKWFLQAEFRYGAPQLTRDLQYIQKSRLDTPQQIRTTTNTRLKKTFYHQLPFSFNYYLLRNLSVGAGGVWNRFNAAVSEMDIIQHRIPTGLDSIVSKGMILKSNQADSNFAKSYFQALFETQYKWKRFSFGARYTFGLQPYLQFTLPGGIIRREKNQSMQVFIRYEIWQSGN